MYVIDVFDNSSAELLKFYGERIVNGNWKSIFTPNKRNRITPNLHITLGRDNFNAFPGQPKYFSHNVMWIFQKFVQ